MGWPLLGYWIGTGDAEDMLGFCHQLPD